MAQNSSKSLINVAVGKIKPGQTLTILAMALLTTVFAPSISSAANYYVCNNGLECNAGAGSGWSTGNSSNAGTSKAAPWRCPKDMQNKLVAGDTVLIGNGTYTFGNCGNRNHLLSTAGMTGTVNAPIVIKAENKWGAVWDGEETDSNDANRGVYLVLVQACSFVEFHDIELKRSKAGFWGNNRRNPCHDITFKGIKEYDHGFTGIATKLNYYNINIDSSYFSDGKDNLTHDENHRCGHNHNLYLMGYNINVTNTVLHSSGGGSMLTVGGMCSSGTRDPVGFTHQIHAVNNTFDGNGCVVTYTEPSGDKRFNSIDFWNRAFTPKHCADEGGTPRNFKNVIFENNLMLGGQTATWRGEQPQFVGNTNSESIQNPPECKHWPWWSDSCENATNGDAGYLIFNNNVAETRALNPQHQQWADEYKNNCDECDGINVANKSEHDYKPTAGSIALIGKGSTNNAPGHDILGNPRPPGSVDVGAFQFSSSGTAPPPAPKATPPTFEDL